MGRGLQGGAGGTHKNIILLVLISKEIILQPELFSPPCFRIQRASPKHDGGRRTDILVFNIGHRHSQLPNQLYWAYIFPYCPVADSGVAALKIH